MSKDYIYTYDPTMISTKTVGEVLKMANGLAKLVQSYRIPDKLYRNLEILNRDRKHRMEELKKAIGRGRRK